MCLGIPGKIVETFEEHGLPMARVDFGGVFRSVCLAHTPQAEAGVYILVHVGFALQVIDEDEANQLFAFVRELNESEEQPTGEL
ncbi:MAG: HypC/HybG/HupF family hydrogenase formation chaperone [Planctomycetaceae bacterium]|nr:HypC/HybG/HupF family hydrogenase formation chaperone [Planctomycetaceae bacterium]